MSHVEFTAKDSHVVAAYGSGEALVYSNVNNTASGGFRIPRSQSISALRTNSIKRNYVVAGSREGVVAVWDINRNKSAFFIGSHKAPITAVEFSPINSELVVSTGLDRQFCLYDIGDNKCIANIFVENSITSVDFSPDGKFIVMASQNGKIHVYDTKNLQQPVHSFEAHKSAIKHLSFRKTEDFESSFCGSHFENETKEETEAVTTGEKRTSVEQISMPSEDNFSESVVNATADSFAAALSLEINETSENVSRLSFSNKVVESTKKISVGKFTPPNPSRLVVDKIFLDSRNNPTSTPSNYVNNHPQFGLSPITSIDGKNLCNVAAGDNSVQGAIASLSEEIKSMREEMKTVCEEAKNDRKYYSTHHLSETRQMFLDLLMSMVKDSIKSENNLNLLKEYLVGEVLSNLPKSQGELLDENLALRQKIDLLEEELSILKHNRDNAN